MKKEKKAQKAQKAGKNKRSKTGERERSKRQVTVADFEGPEDLDGEEMAKFITSGMGHLGRRPHGIHGPGAPGDRYASSRGAGRNVARRRRYIQKWMRRVWARFAALGHVIE